MMQGILLQRDGQSWGWCWRSITLVVRRRSWRILLDELRQVADSAMQGQPITLPPEEPRSMSGLHAYEPTLNAGKPSCGSGGGCWRTAHRVWGDARWIA
ncbi:hypothetical protein ACF0H2_07740 [Serratia marcescens]